MPDYARTRKLAEFPLAGHPRVNEYGIAGNASGVFFYCDDIEKTVAELSARGVEFTDIVADHGYGLVTYFKMPGVNKVQLFQPRYTRTGAKR